MGDVKDAEPLHKRLKILSLYQVKKQFGNSSNKELVSVSLGDAMARLLFSKEDGEIIGSRGVIKKHEFVKIITKALYSLGYDKTGALLQEESGIKLHAPALSLFLEQVQDGKWEESLATLQTVAKDDLSIVKSASFLILEQKLLEHLRDRKHIEALHTLRNEIVPLSVNMGRVHELSSSIISPLRPISLGLESRLRLIEKLQSLLPAANVVPERRLELLLEQALDMQQFNCALHNTSDKERSLLRDHQCGSSQIPSQTLQVWQKGTGELLSALPGSSGAVNCVSWNPRNPQMLASASDDRTIRIWVCRFPQQ